MTHCPRRSAAGAGVGYAMIDLDDWRVDDPDRARRERIISKWFYVVREIEIGIPNVESALKCVAVQELDLIADEIHLW